MAFSAYRKLSISLLCLVSSFCYAQRLEFNGGVLLKSEITLGNQNQWLKLGILGFGTANLGDAAIESGISLASYTFLKRHTVKQSGFSFSYEFFTLVGIGQNSNLLGATVSNENTAVLFDATGEGGFNGIGFGFGKDFLPKQFKSYSLRRGAIILRFSNANHSIHLAFKNDLKIRIFNGEGTDYAATGSLNVGFANIQDINSIYQFGFGVDLFTARPDYSRPPRNPINSDDGRKNVWFTLPPFKDLFYGNIYGYGLYQNNDYSVYAKLGVNSQKAGAFIQNTLHDGYGLNPRFPWRVETNDKLFFEVSGNIFYNEVSDEN